MYLGERSVLLVELLEHGGSKIQQYLQGVACVMGFHRVANIVVFTWHS